MNSKNACLDFLKNLSRQDVPLPSYKHVQKPPIKITKTKKETGRGQVQMHMCTVWAGRVKRKQQSLVNHGQTEAKPACCDLDKLCSKCCQNVSHNLWHLASVDMDEERTGGGAGEGSWGEQ